MPTVAARPVWLFVPNIIGYVRIAMVAVAFAAFHPSHPRAMLALLGVSAVLDVADGIAARVLDQRSSFGAFLDVAIDIAHRALVWATVAPVCGAAVTTWEALVFVCTHSLGSAWKASVDDAPSVVKHVMADNFKRPLGAWAMAGVWGLPHALFVQTRLDDLVPDGMDAGSASVPARTVRATVVLCAVGRALALSAEWFFFTRRMQALLEMDASARSATRGIRS